MRNVTIVESNVEPNKEHLWLYNGKLKWFGPNGWEDICVCKSPSPSSTTTTTPKPVVPPATTSSPIPGSDVRFTNNTNTDIQIYGVLYNGDTASPPMQPGQTYILRYISDGVAVYNSPNCRPFDSLKITAFRGKEQEDVSCIIDTDAIVNGVMYKFPEGLSWEEITEISIEGSIQGTGTTSSTPTPNSIKFTNNTNVSLTLNRVNNVDEGLVSSPIQPNQQYILVHNANDANTDSYIEIYATSESDVLPPFSFLKITAFKDGGQEYDVPYEYYQDAMETSLYKFSFKELIEKGFTTVSINGNISNPTPTTTTSSTTTSSSTPAPITEQQILVSNVFIGEDGPTFGITMNNNINFDNVVPSRLHSLSPNASGIYVTYTPSSRYLAVVSPKTNGFKDTIVATILVPVDGSFEYESHTLYPINSMDNESSKYFLFDLSKSPYVGTAAYSNPYVELHNYNSHSISSIPPFIDGNIPPFADEE